VMAVLLVEVGERRMGIVTEKKNKRKGSMRKTRKEGPDWGCAWI
jgi:hypothetical protein